MRQRLNSVRLYASLGDYHVPCKTLAVVLYLGLLCDEQKTA